MPHDMKLPEIGEGIESGTVVSVLVEEGDRIEIDQPVLELETDKAVVEVPSTVAGVVRQVRVQVNAEARIGQVVLTVEEGGPSERSDVAELAGAGASAVAAAAELGGSVRAAAVSSPVVSAPTAPDVAMAPGEGAAPLVPAAPSVRRLARELGVELRQLVGTGILGRITPEDVRRFAEGGTTLPYQAGGAHGLEAPPLPDFSRWGEIERVPMSGIRKATVRSMTAAWATVPMVTNFDEADATEFEALRQRYKGIVEKAGAKLTPTAMLLKIVAGALRRFPEFNASLDVGAQEIVFKRYVNLGTAVDTEHGLLVPVIRNADRKSVLELSLELGQIADKARARKLTPDDLSGGNFIVSNLGGIGGTSFTPIVTPPDVAILGVSRAAMKPVWEAERGDFAARLVMPLALTYDHRLIDGAAAARFLRWICRAVQEPFLLTLEG